MHYNMLRAVCLYLWGRLDKAGWSGWKCPGEKSSHQADTAAAPLPLPGPPHASPSTSRTSTSYSHLHTAKPMLSYYITVSHSLLRLYNINRAGLYCGLANNVGTKHCCSCSVANKKHYRITYFIYQTDLKNIYRYSLLHNLQHIIKILNSTVVQIIHSVG